MTYNKEENYCTMSPDSLFGVRFNYACYVHDRQYRDEIENRKSRKNADISFRRMLYAEFKRKDKPLRGFFVSWIYYFGVRIFGGSAYASSNI